MTLDVDRLEELLLNAAEGETEAQEKLLSELREQPENVLASSSRELWERWHEAAEMVVDSQEDVNSDTLLEVLHQFARLGYDTPALRDRLGEAARQQFSSYPDPGGLLSALGMRPPEIPVHQLPVRWRMFEQIAEGGLCCHPWHGTGAIMEIEGLSNEIRVFFEQTLDFSLRQFLDAFHLIRQDSLLARMMSSKQAGKELEKEAAKGELLRRLKESLLPIPESPEILRRCLQAQEVSDKILNSVFEIPDTTLPESEHNEQKENLRNISAARSLQELKLALEKDWDHTLSEQERGHITDLLAAASERPEQVFDFAESALLIWEKSDDSQWLIAELRSKAENSVCWKDEQCFIQISERLAARRQLAWYSLTTKMLGPENTAQLILRLPLKNLTQAQRSLSRETRDKNYFARVAAETLKAGQWWADIIVWLWQNGEPEEKEVIRDPRIVFAALARETRGSFIKADRDLRNLLLQNENFQRFLMRDGDSAAVGRMVSCIRNYGQALASGEKQSLLVRLVRLFPEARELIENRGAKVRKDQTSPPESQAVTSTRSYEERKQELREIISLRIPANSRAIAHAREFGDLRENAEYKAAKEEQSRLLNRRQQLEQELKQVKPTIFEDIGTPEKVVPGCTVQLRYPGESGPRRFHILGCWDSDPYQDIISYETPIGRSLLGRKIGDTVETPQGKAQVEALLPLTAEMRQWLAGENDAETKKNQ